MSKIRIVVPDGSMQKKVSTLFENAGLPITIENERTNEGSTRVDWIEQIVFQRPQQIPDHIDSGYFDLGIVGEDWIAESGYTFPTLLTLPIGRAGTKPVKIVLAVDEAGVEKAEDLPEHCEIATEYVNLSKQFFSDIGKDNIKIRRSYGNTENQVRYGASAIIDLTETGNSLRKNNLKIIAEVMKSSTVVIAHPKSLDDKAKKKYIDCLVRMLDGAFKASARAMLTANVPEDVLDEASQIIGGLKGATRSPLHNKEGWYALESVIKKEDEQEIIFKLLQIGVTDIIVNRNIPLIMS